MEMKKVLRVAKDISGAALIIAAGVIAAIVLLIMAWVMHAIGKPISFDFFNDMPG
jgi:diacylglycerol kinase